MSLAHDTTAADFVSASIRCPSCGQDYDAAGAHCCSGTWTVSPRPVWAVTPPPERGWQCPVCKSVWAPAVRGCERCNEGRLGLAHRAQRG